MNPIMSLIRKPASPANPLPNNNMKQMIGDLKAGKIDAKQTALAFLKNMTPQQKVAIQRMLPQLKVLGKTFGASDNSINAFTAELQKQLG